MPLVPLQEADPMRYKALIESTQQPNAQLGLTGAQTGAQTAQTALSGQELLNAKLLQPPAQAKVDQLDIINKAGTYFDKHKGKDGFVKPQDYNNFLSQYTEKGGNSADFEGKFADRYVSPNNIFYDTPDAKTARGSLPLIKQVVDSYSKLNKEGPLWQKLTQIPGVGNLFAQGLLHQETAHNTFLTGQIGNIRQIAGAGPQQGFRFNLTELNNISNLLPNAYDNKSTANDKLDQLNTFLESKMGTDLHTVLKGQY